MKNRGNSYLYAVADDKRLELLKLMLTTTIEFIKEKNPPVDLEARELVKEVAILLDEKRCSKYIYTVAPVTTFRILFWLKESYRLTSALYNQSEVAIDNLCTKYYCGSHI